MRRTTDAVSDALAAKVRWERAELAAQDARRRYHAQVNRLASDGLSVREIGRALGVSHQRVHQILGGLACQFCRAKNVGETYLLSAAELGGAAPAYICERCVYEGLRCLRSPARGGERFWPERGAEGVRCSLCSAACGEPGVFAHACNGPDAICNRCLSRAAKTLDREDEGRGHDADAAPCPLAAT
jgi:hypothetical protein